MKKRIVVVVLLLCVILLIFFMPKKNTDEYIKDDSYTHIIGVSVPNITEPWIYDMIQVIEDLKDKKYFDYNIILYESESNSQKQVEDIKTLYEYGMDVLVVVPDESEIVDNEISEIYKEIPVITVGNHCKGEYTCSIRYDDYKIGEMAAEYILEEVYRANNDVFILTEENNFSRSEDIKRGFVDRAKDKIDPDHMTFVDASSLESIADSRMKEYLLLKEKPCVVFGFNDDMAYGAYKAARDWNVTGIKYVGVGCFKNKYEGDISYKRKVLSASIELPHIGRTVMDTADKILKKERIVDEIIADEFNIVK